MYTVRLRTSFLHVLKHSTDRLSSSRRCFSLHTCHLTGARLAALIPASGLISPTSQCVCMYVASHQGIIRCLSPFLTFRSDPGASNDASITWGAEENNDTSLKMPPKLMTINIVPRLESLIVRYMWCHSTDFIKNESFRMNICPVKSQRCKPLLWCHEIFGICVPYVMQEQCYISLLHVDVTV